MEEKEVLNALRRIRALADVSPDTLRAVITLIRYSRNEAQNLVFSGPLPGLEDRAKAARAITGVLSDLEATLTNPRPMIALLEGAFDNPVEAAQVAAAQKVMAPWYNDVRKSLQDIKIER